MNMLTLQKFKNTNIFIFLWSAMSVFQHFRINLSLRKDYFNNLFANQEYSDNNKLNNERHQFINDVFNSTELFFGQHNKFVYSKINEVDDVIIGTISKRKKRKNRFDYNQEEEEIPHYEQTLVFINNSQTDDNNWQTIWIMENGTDFKSHLQKLLTDLWKKSNPNNDIFDVNIRPFLENYTDNFLNILRNPNEYKISKITEIKIHYDVANHGFGDYIRKSMQSVGAVEFNSIFKSENGLKLHNEDEIKKHIEPIGNAINGYVIMKGVQFNQTTKSEVHHTGKNAKIKTTTTTKTFTANEIIGDKVSIIDTINQLKNDKK